jgi:hypothetical protein
MPSSGQARFELPPEPELKDTTCPRARLDRAFDFATVILGRQVLTLG